MFETLMRLYNGGKGKLTVAMLANAVIKGWISEAGKQVIMGTADAQ
ncbi:XkdX family protein [Lacrimispora sp.]|nr:XkdX family protein [Lacrimispora sp.]